MKKAPLYLTTYVCAAVHPTTGEPIMITRGEPGYRPFASEFAPATAVRLFNESLHVTPEQVKAMLAGSMFGWDCPAANPQHATR
jgi:hypothetical protein